MKRRRESSNSSDDDKPDVRRCRIDRIWNCIEPTVTHISYIWTIQRDQICTRFYGEEDVGGYGTLTSPTFLTNVNGSTSTWFLELGVKEEDYDDSDDDSAGEEEYLLSMHLCLDSSHNHKIVNAKFTLSVWDEKLGELMSPRTKSHNFDPLNPVKCYAGFDDFVKDKNDLFKSDGLLRGDCLKIKCELTVGKNKNSCRISTHMNEIYLIQELKINPLKSLFDSKEVLGAKVKSGQRGENALVNGFRQLKISDRFHQFPIDRFDEHWCVEDVDDKLESVTKAIDEEASELKVDPTSEPSNP